MTGANRHLSDGPMVAIVLEGIALLLYWPGTLVHPVLDQWVTWLASRRWQAREQLRIAS